MIYADTDPTINQFGEWLTRYGFYVALGMAGVVFLVVLVLFIIAMVKRKKEATPLITPKSDFNADLTIINALGGKENIVSKSLNGSRIVIVLVDYDKIDETTLNNNGVDSLIKMSNKVTLVSKDNSEKIYKSLPENIEK